MWPDWGDVKAFFKSAGRNIDHGLDAAVKFAIDPVKSLDNLEAGLKSGRIQHALVKSLAHNTVKFALGEGHDRAKIAGNVTGEVVQLGLMGIAGGDIAKAGEVGEIAKVAEGAGAARAAKFGSQWATVSVDEAIAKFAPGVEGMVSGQKTLYKNAETGIQVVYDNAGDYFRIQDTNYQAKDST